MAMIALVLIVGTLLVVGGQSAGVFAEETVAPGDELVDPALPVPRVQPDATTGAADRPNGEPDPDEASEANRSADSSADANEATRGADAAAAAERWLGRAELERLRDLALSGAPADAERVVVDTRFVTRPDGEVVRERLAAFVVEEGAGRRVSGDAEVTLTFAFAYRERGGAGSAAEEPADRWVVYDSTLRRRVPLTMSLETPDLPAAMRRGLVGARIGELRVIESPAWFAYGEEGRPPIPPNARKRFVVRAIETE